MNDDTIRFQYLPRCSERACERPAEFKIGAPWMDATHQELKHYGLACKEHREPLLTRARAHRDRLVVIEGEAVGPVALYQFAPGLRDRDLSPAEKP